LPTAPSTPEEIGHRLSTAINDDYDDVDTRSIWRYMSDSAGHRRAVAMLYIEGAARLTSAFLGRH
jgi:hypothetical protein